MRGLNGLISSDGRLGRRGYLLGFVVPSGVTLALTWVGLSGAFGEASDRVMMVAALGWVLMLFGVGDALNIRRYHDLGSSGRMYRLLRPLVVLLPVLAFGLQFLMPATAASMGDMDALVYMIGQDMNFRIAPIPLAILVVWGSGLILNVAYLCIMPGDDGPNEFGGDPGKGGGAPSPGAASIAAGDPVERALAEYRANLAKPQAATPVARSLPLRSAGSFGRKR